LPLTQILALAAPQVTEDRLRSMLEQMSERDSKQSKITIQRRRPMFDEDD
jgi:uncharacterized protein YneF (UPF0154 family)